MAEGFSGSVALTQDGVGVSFGSASKRWNANRKFSMPPSLSPLHVSSNTSGHISLTVPCLHLGQYAPWILRCFPPKNRWRRPDVEKIVNLYTYQVDKFLHSFELYLYLLVPVWIPSSANSMRLRSGYPVVWMDLIHQVSKNVRSSDWIASHQ